MLCKIICKVHTCYRYCSLLPKFNVNEKILQYIAGPLGSKFEENIKQQWINFCALNLEIGFFTLYINNSDKSRKKLLNNLKEIKKICNFKIPVGINIINNSETNNGRVSINDEEGPLLQSLIFLSPGNSQHVYFQWLRQRKIWWSRFSVSPGHILIQDESSSLMKQYFKNHLLQISSIISDKIYDVNIVIKIQDQILLMENIGMYEQNSKTGLYMEDSFGKILPHVVVSSINLKKACIGILQECLDKDNNLILHHNLAPFQCRVICDYADAENSNELKDLGQYLCGLLRKSHVSTLYSHNDSNLFNILRESNEMGIPYCLIIRANSLKNGFVYLRNRDTTLEEQLHVSDIPKYIEKLCKK